VKRLFTMLIVLSVAFTMAWAQNDLDLTFEDATDVANWGVHGGTSGYTTVAQNATAGVDGTGGLVLGDGGYGYYIKRPIAATPGKPYRLVVDVKSVGWDTPGTYPITLAVEGLEASENSVSINALAGFTKIVIEGVAANASGYIKLQGSNTTLANAGGLIEVTLDNLMFDDDPPPPPGPFFSQWIEGSSYNKALEIFNPTDATINLDDYAFPNVSNDPTTVGVHEYWNAFTVGATIAPGEVYVIAHPSADPAILAEADQEMSFLSNGDDGFALVMGIETDYEVIDFVGDFNGDPGSGWDVAGVLAATADHTIFRKAHVMHGNADWMASAGVDKESSEWIVGDKDVFDGLGSFPEDFRPMVHFEVNMAHQILKANFDPASDYVDIAGDMNGWGPAAGEWQLTAHPDTNGIWVGEFPIAEGEYGFKFRINSSWDAGKHDGGDNRNLHVGDMGGHYFGYLDHYTHYPVIFFGVDLTDKFNNAEFDPAVDSVNVAGSFNGWGGDPGDLHPMMDDPLKWGAFIDQDGAFAVDDALEFKFRINENWDNAESLDNRKHKVVAGLQEYKVFWNNYDYNLAVTFEVNMNAKMDAGEFNPATQYVDVAGNFNGWGPAAGDWQLTDEDADGIWSITVADSFTVGQELEFKFRIDSDWGKSESDPNRKYIVGGGAQTFYDWWNRFDPNFVGAPVTFKVNMNAQIDAALFTAGTDNVLVTGVFGAIPMDDGDADGIYEVTASVPLGLTFFRYRINADSPENLPFDRSVVLDVPDTPVVLDVVWFSNVTEVRSGSGNITFRVDMTVLQGLGFYDRALGDSLELRGGVNDWGGNPDRSLIEMIRQPGTEIYFLTVPFTGDAGEVFTYKFFLNLHQTAGGDSAQHAGEDFFEYELPAGAGGGDRFFVWNGLDADTVLPVQTYQDYRTAGIIPRGETVHAVLYMDMSEAMHYEDNPFDPATDSLYFIWQDSWGAELQGLQAGNLAEDKLAYLYETTWQSKQRGKNVYQVTVPITGPAPHALMYTTRYVKGDGTEVDEMGAGYGFGRFRTQWLKPETVGGPIAAVQGLETVKFSNLGTPLEVFPEPYANQLTFANPVSTEVENLPTSFALSQNYPNPFNPTTTISYVIPEAVNVELIVFDITGREVTRLVDNRNHNAGRYDVMWNGLNDAGERVASGLYFYRIMAGDFQQTNKMLMLK